MSTKRIEREIKKKTGGTWPTRPPLRIATATSQSDVKMPSVFFPLLDYYLMMSECSYSRCVVSVFGTSLCCLRICNTCSEMRYD